MSLSKFKMSEQIYIVFPQGDYFIDKIWLGLFLFKHIFQYFLDVSLDRPNSVKESLWSRSPKSLISVVDVYGTPFGCQVKISANERI